jgi:hypothetical protein
MASDYAPTPVEDFLDPDDPTLFPVVLSGALDIIDQAPEGDPYFTQCREGTFYACPVARSERGTLTVLSDASSPVRPGKAE